MGSTLAENRRPAPRQRSNISCCPGKKYLFKKKSGSLRQFSQESHLQRGGVFFVVGWGGRSGESIALQMLQKSIFSWEITQMKKRRKACKEILTGELENDALRNLAGKRRALMMELWEIL